MKKKSIIVFIIISIIALMSVAGAFFHYNKKPYFSIIISSYNYGKYISQTIDSVLNSTFKDFELIVINDGSTDNTSEILKTYQNNKKITIIEHENQGLSLSRNKAMKIAKGKYFWFVDSDDWIDNDALLTLYHKTKDTDLDLISFYTYQINHMKNQNSIDGYSNLPRRLNNAPDETYTISDLSEYDLISYPVTSGKQIYRREFVQKNNIEFPPKTIFEDDVFFLHNIFAGAKISAVKKALYYKRKHSSAITADTPKHFGSYIKICQEIWDRTHQYPSHNDKATFISNIYIYNIPLRWSWLTPERKYEFYHHLISMQNYLNNKPNTPEWNEKRDWFNKFLDSPFVSPYKPK